MTSLWTLLIPLLISFQCLRPLQAEPTPAAASAFGSYTRDVEGRLDRQHQSPDPFLILAPESAPTLRQGGLLLEQIRPPDEPALSGALLSHWRGTAFVPGAKAADLEKILRDYDAYPQNFAPQIVKARVLSRRGDSIQAALRVRQKHVITVVLDTTYDVTFARLDVTHGDSASRSTQITEVERAGTAGERALNSSEEHGFLWRINTYWTWVERDGGLYLQVESVSLSRAIPAGLGWALRPYVESVPRESLAFTLGCVRSALQKGTR